MSNSQTLFDLGAYEREETKNKTDHEVRRITCHVKKTEYERRVPSRKKKPAAAVAEQVKTGFDEVAKIVNQRKPYAAPKITELSPTEALERIAAHRNLDVTNPDEPFAEIIAAAQDADRQRTARVPIYLDRKEAASTGIKFGYFEILGEFDIVTAFGCPHCDERRDIKESAATALAFLGNHISAAHPDVHDPRIFDHVQQRRASEQSPTESSMTRIDLTQPLPPLPSLAPDNALPNDGYMRPPSSLLWRCKSCGAPVSIDGFDTLGNSHTQPHTAAPRLEPDKPVELGDVLMTGGEILADPKHWRVTNPTGNLVGTAKTGDRIRISVESGEVKVIPAPDEQSPTNRLGYRDEDFNGVNPHGTYYDREYIMPIDNTFACAVCWRTAGDAPDDAVGDIGKVRRHLVAAHSTYIETQEAIKASDRTPINLTQPLPNMPSLAPAEPPAAAKFEVDRDRRLLELTAVAVHGEVHARHTRCGETFATLAQAVEHECVAERLPVSDDVVLLKGHLVADAADRRREREAMRSKIARVGAMATHVREYLDDIFEMLAEASAALDASERRQLDAERSRNALVGRKRGER